MFSLGLKILAAVILLIIITVVFVLPLKIPYNIKVPGKIIPAKEWVISKSVGGQLFTFTRDNKTGITTNYSLSEFDRGDAVQIIMRNGISLGSSIRMNDTIGYIFSNVIQLQFTELKGQLETAKANLELNLSGEKESVIREAEENLTLMKKQAEEQNKIFQRQKILYDKKLISEEEFEISHGITELNDINIAIAEAQLLSVKTGSKQEQVKLISSQIRSLESELEIISKRISDFNLICPFPGMITQVSKGDTLLIVSDTNEYIIVMPVNWQENMNVLQGQNVSVNIPQEKEDVYADLMKIGKEVFILNGQQVLFVTASVKNGNHKLVSGLMVQCEINCGSITVSEYLNRLIKLKL